MLEDLETFTTIPAFEVIEGNVGIDLKD